MNDGMNATMKTRRLPARCGWCGTLIRRLHFFGVVVLCVLPIAKTNGGAPEYRRCRNSARAPPNVSTNDTHPNNSNHSSPTTTTTTAIRFGNRSTHHPAALHEFLTASRCEPCPVLSSLSSASSTFSILSHKTRAVVVLTSVQSLDRLLIVAAGLLTSGSRVSLLTMVAPTTNANANNTSSSSSSSSSSSKTTLPDQNRIRQLLFHHIPCDKHVVSSILLTFHRFAAASEPESCGTNLDRCRTTGGLPNNKTALTQTMQALQQELNFLAQPAVLILDATFVAGLLVAEQQRLPAILVAAADTMSWLLEHLPVEERRTETGRWSTWAAAYRTAVRILHTRYQDVTARTGPFLTLNAVRNDLSLARVRHLSDLWRTGGTVLLLALDNPDLAPWHRALPNVPIWSDPLVPRCVSCINDDNNNQAPPVGVTHPERPCVLVVDFGKFGGRGNSLLYVRRLFQALELARASIRLLADEEEGDRVLSTTASTGHADTPIGWAQLVDFYTVLQTRKTTPDFSSLLVLDDTVYYQEETVLLDSLARHNPVLLVALCADDASDHSWMLGFPVLCVDFPSWSVRKIAFRFLDVWRRRHPTTLDSAGSNTTAGAKKHAAGSHTSSATPLSTPIPTDDGDDGLEGIVAAIERIGLIRDHYHQNWKNAGDIKKHLMRDFSRNMAAVKRNPGELNTNRTLTSAVLVMAAWLVLISAILYYYFFIAMKHEAAVQKIRLQLRRWNNQRHGGDNSLFLYGVVDELLFRLPDLDLAVAMGTKWISEQMRRWDAVSPSTTTLSDVNTSRDPIDSQSNLRRKRNTAKKRH